MSIHITLHYSMIAHHNERCAIRELLTCYLRGHCGFPCGRVALPPTSTLRTVSLPVSFLV